MIDRLVSAGMVKRQANPNDRRGTMVVVAKRAARKFGPLFMSARTAQDKLLESFSEQELEILSSYFKKSAVMFAEERRKIA